VRLAAAGLAFSLAASPVSASAAEARAAVIDKGGAFACVSWAGWHEYTLASLTPKGAPEQVLSDPAEGGSACRDR
jgi:hypothetical protein